MDAVRLDEAGARGAPVVRIAGPRFRVPATAAVRSDRIPLPNARFDGEPTPRIA